MQKLDPIEYINSWLGFSAKYYRKWIVCVYHDNLVECQYSYTHNNGVIDFRSNSHCVI